jgi:hypothetical protein
VAGFSSRGPSAVQPLILKVYKPFVSSWNEYFSYFYGKKVSQMVYGGPIFKNHLKL